MSLSPQAIKVVQETAPVVAQHAVEITKLFYQTMFTNNPEVLTFFNKSHQRTGDQPETSIVTIYNFCYSCLDLLQFRNKPS